MKNCAMIVGGDNTCMCITHDHVVTDATAVANLQLEVFQSIRSWNTAKSKFYCINILIVISFDVKH